MKKIVPFSMLTATLVFGEVVKPVDNTLYLKECGSCHFAFSPGLLPKRFWVKMMAKLDNHFGTDASLDSKDTQTLLSYMVKNSGDKVLITKIHSQRLIIYAE